QRPEAAAGKAGARTTMSSHEVSSGGRLASGSGARAGSAASGGAPQRRAATPAEQPHARAPPKRLGQLGLGHGDEPMTDPDAVEALRPGEQGVDAFALVLTERA